jgi:cytochrome c biogenesis protein CcmG/thiol:disulfide interchange protein DsbE
VPAHGEDARAAPNGEPMKKRLQWLIAGGSACGLALLTLPMLPSTSVGAGPSCATDAPPAKLDFTLRDMNGADVRLADHRGKVILLNFWATWCGPCRVEIPAFVELQQQYRDKGLSVLGVSIDDTPDQLKPFAEKMKINYPLLLLQTDVEDAYGPLWAVPTTFVIGRDGSVCNKHIGPATREQLEAEIKALL